jgi:hypothetical protein
MYFHPGGASFKVKNFYTWNNDSGSGNLAEFAVHQDRGGQISLSSQPQPI